VFGFQLAVVGDGFSYAELEEYAKDIKKELSLVKNVARVGLWGVQNKKRLLKNWVTCLDDTHSLSLVINILLSLTIQVPYK
jgi:hypothetical protein